MANDDAVLRIGVEDQMSGALKKIEAEVRAFGTIVGAEAKDVNKSLTSVNKMMGSLGASGQTTRLTKAREELAKYNQEVQKLSNASKVTTDASGAMRGANGKFISATQVAAYQAALTNVEKKTAEIQKMTSGSWFPPDMLKSAENLSASLTGASNATRYLLYDVARNAAIAGAAVGAFGTGAIIAAASFEKSFAAVNRTVSGTSEQLKSVHDDLVKMSQTIPVAFGDLSQIAAVGGQMGIGAAGIASFTETVAKLTATTNLSSDAASTALGRFKAFFATADDPSLAVTDKTFTNLASSILKVGVNSVATETGIVGVATQISSMGAYAGLSADQVIGLAGALSSVGVPPELSRGVITRLFNTMSSAVSAGGVKLQDFAGISGHSAQEFQDAWGTDKFGYIFTDFIRGLNGLKQGTGDAVATLHELGITSVRDVPVLLRLAGAADNAGVAGGLLAQTMNDARSGWRDNIELTLQYTKISETLAARFQVLLQNFEAFFATVGQGSLGPVKGFVDLIIGMVEGLTAIANTPAGQVISFIATGISLLGGALLLTIAAFAGVGAAATGAAKGLIAFGASEEFVASTTRGMSIALASLGVVGLIAAIAGAIVGFANASNDALNPISDLNGALSSLQEDTKNNDGFEFFTAATSDAGTQARDTSDQATNLGKVLKVAQDEAYGAGDALTGAGDAAGYAALKFGDASIKFLSSSEAASGAFQDLFSATDAGAKFTKLLTEGGFSLDRFNSIMAEKGRDAAQAYLEGITGVDTTKGIDQATIGIRGFFGQNDVADLQAQLLGIGEQGVNSFHKAAQAADVAGDGMIHFTSATQLSTAAMDDFQVQNEEAIKAISSGFQKFVDPAGLITFTQQLNDANAQTGDDKKAAIAAYGKAWVDAYGGASFKLSDYMTQFQKAADEQTKFTENIQTLFSRGLDPAIIGDLASMGPQAAQLVQALVDSTDTELQKYEQLYQDTGFDSMVALAAGQLAAQQIVVEAAKTLTNAQLVALSADLAAGTPLVDAMKKWQLDAEGKPLTVEAKAQMDWDAEQKRLQSMTTGHGLYIPIEPYIPHPNIAVTPPIKHADGSYSAGRVRLYAQGGYTGDGGRYDPAGIVHAGEFVFPQESVKALGVGNLYAMMRSTKGGTPGARAGGYASGGLTKNGGNMVYLSPEDRNLLRALGELRVYIGNREIARAQGDANFATTRQGV